MRNEGIIREKRKLSNGRVTVAVTRESITKAEVLCLKNLCLQEMAFARARIYGTARAPN